MNIIKDNEFLPVEIKINEGEESATIRPIKPYEPNKTYSVLVFLNNGNKYKMDFETADYGDIDDNDTILTAGQVKLGEPVEGYISNEASDYYFVNISESGKLDLKVQRYDTDNINLVLLRLDGTDKGAIMFEDSSGLTDYAVSAVIKSSREISTNIEPGTYYIKINTPYKYKSNSYASTSGNYKLWVDHTPSNVEEDVENNDSIKDAIEIGINSANTGHIMYTRNDGSNDLHDYYRIEVPTSGRLEIDLQRYDTNNINLALLRLDDTNRGETILTDTSDISSYVSYAALKSDRNISVDIGPGTYFIKVNTRYTSKSYYYDGSSGEYKLWVNHTPSNVEDDMENNDSIKNAATIGVNSINTGHIMYTRNDGNKDLSDYYRIEVPTSGRLEIDLQRYDTNNINLSLLQLDATDREEAIYNDTSDISGYVSYAALKSDRNISVDIEAGTYFVKVNTRYNSKGYYYDGSSGEYKLSLKFE